MLLELVSGIQDESFALLELASGLQAKSFAFLELASGLKDESLALLEFSSGLQAESFVLLELASGLKASRQVANYCSTTDPSIICSKPEDGVLFKLLLERLRQPFRQSYASLATQ